MKISTTLFTGESYFLKITPYRYSLPILKSNALIKTNNKKSLLFITFFVIMQKLYRLTHQSILMNIIIRRVFKMNESGRKICVTLPGKLKY